MELSDDLMCLFNAEVERTDDGFVVRVPDREVETGAVDPGTVYRVALMARNQPAESSASRSSPDGPQPPVEEGEMRYVEIEDLGKQGDGRLGPIGTGA